MDIALPLEHQEQDLIKACIGNERWAQKKLYESFYGPMMGVCMRYSSTDDEALDILHEGFIKVFRNISKYQAGTSLKAWIRRIMVTRLSTTTEKTSGEGLRILRMHLILALRKLMQ